MNFNIPLLKPIRIILFPFSLIYYAVIYIRNRLFDNKILSTSSFGLPIICVGNIAVGGTGKSPMVEFLLRNLGNKYNLATLSRGYKRKTKGYVLADANTNALDIGDEPMQFHLKFPGVAVAVGEERILAIPQLLHDRKDTRAIILDDAFQHRAIQAGYNILLTEYANLYTRDWYLPTGDLRDEKSSVKRADLIIVTKCPADLSQSEAEAIRKELNPLPEQQVFFAGIRYGNLYHIIHHLPYQVTGDIEVLLVSGIANPRPLKKLLADQSQTYEEMAYSDHHIFTIDDMKEISRRFEQMTGKLKIILTTEKDAVRLVKFEQELKDIPLYVIPIEMEFLFGDTDRFCRLIGTFIEQFSAAAKPTDE
ncbi:tetraacyldisaccharide 4'-kinase [Flavihumibacter profundi]|jgi:tetraacyldisaccharide 4'-kinase|uniref:tetraacyldisaccharide 4'-kinase n=1 Tax=Flavihumibacter profundi TaxID=2716883 RepID=UPI001CC3D774|nr:tetraacyldisaccharide 4'-kinase [Flavihumibacter profundi]MBZ5855958.1 tetraacyldisaccharide 4'-kinase [Flavihumibacter profundi]